MPELLLSLHDVAPVHLERLRRAEEVLERLGVTRITYLLVPDFHGRGRADRDPAFAAWLGAPRPFEVRWALHGYTHRDDAPADPHPTLAERWKARHMTGGEGEFLRRDAAVLEDRLRRGLEVFRGAIGAGPDGFVAPAWLYTPALPPLLSHLGFAWTEDHRAVHDLRGGRRVAAPVITWATRTPLRKRTSIWGTPLLWRRWRQRPVLRLAVHPHDFDHPDTVDSIARVWRAALAAGAQRWPQDVIA
jgi:predicted deacetylase